MISAQQTAQVPVPQQAFTLQSGGLPVSTSQLDIGNILNLMITMMIVVMMMKTMTKAFDKVPG